MGRRTIKLFSLQIIPPALGGEADVFEDSGVSRGLTFGFQLYNSVTVARIQEEPSFEL